MSEGRTETIFVGIGDANDPFPEEQKTTKFFVFAGPCPVCRFPSRFLHPGVEVLQLTCRNCGSAQNIGLENRCWEQVTYAHWCRESRFVTDEISLTDGTRGEIEKILKDFDPIRDSASWGVIVVGGGCRHSQKCINEGCMYHKKGSSLGGKVIKIAHRRRKEFSVRPREKK